LHFQLGRSTGLHTKGKREAYRSFQWGGNGEGLTKSVFGVSYDLAIRVGFPLPTHRQRLAALASDPMEAPDEGSEDENGDQHSLLHLLYVGHQRLESGTKEVAQRAKHDRPHRRLGNSGEKAERVESVGSQNDRFCKLKPIGETEHGNHERRPPVLHVQSLGCLARWRGSSFATAAPARGRRKVQAGLQRTGRCQADDEAEVRQCPCKAEPPLSKPSPLPTAPPKKAAE